MPASCCVTDCDLKYAHAEDVSYHKFPLKKPEVLDKWITFTGRESDWVPTKWSAICSRHFKPSDFKDCVYRKNLFHTAVPSLRVKSQATITSYINQPKPDEFEEPVKNSIEQTVVQHEIPQPDPLDQADTDLEDLYSGDDPNLLDITCRLCGIVFSKWCQGLLVDYREHFAVIVKCLPFINLEISYFPSKICGHCLRMINGFSLFYDNVVKAQGDLELKYNGRNNFEQVPFQAPEEPARLKIKQEPLLNIKEEAVDSISRAKETHVDPPENTLIIKNPNVTNDKNKILLFNNQNHDGQHSKQFRESKNCEILEIVNLYPPIVDITSATIKEVQPYEITLPSVSNNGFQQQVTPQLINLKTEDTAESYEDYEDYSCYYQDFQCGLYTLDEHSYSKLPIQADDNKDEIFSTLSEPVQPIRLGDSATIKVIHVELPNEQPKPVFAPVLEHSCQICHRKFVSQLKLIKHRIFSCNLRQTVQFNCIFCLRKFPNRIRQQVHLKFCLERIDRRNKLSIKANQAIKYRKSIARSSSSSTEVQSKSQKQRHKCSLCERTYSRSSNLKRHMASHRPVDQWNHKCGICQKIFDKLFDLKKHFQLAKCRVENSASSETKTDDTALELVNVSDRLLYVCSTCNKQFKSYNSLKVHESIHTGLKVFVCETCGKRFGGQMNLIQHRLTHVDTRQYTCKLCPKVFKRSGGLSQHVKSFHMKIKPYQCPVCRRDFALKADMTRCRHSKLKDSGGILI
ncbi:zinc finger protein 287-like [Armigeres subalbatus]|uniref:zinc finger protein 287-like n=1 Tax=Armigeres subalbatus TaxID=124917 RepID=UPI002ED03281